MLAKPIKHIIFIWMLIMALNAFAQKNELVTVDLNQAPFPTLVQQIETQTSYHIYYNPTFLDTLLVSVHVKSSSVNEVLTQVLASAPYRFAFDADAIFITYQQPILTELPTDFFNKQTNAVDTSKTDLAIHEVFQNKKTKLPVENKLFEIGVKTNNITKGRSIVSGYVRDVKNGEPISGASIYVDSLKTGVMSDQYGYYTLTIPRGQHILHVNSVGMEPTRRSIILYSDGKLNIEMKDFIPSLKTVTVVAQRGSNTRNLQMGAERLTVRTIKQVPVVFGEADVLKVVLALPGVTSVGEGSSGYNVRGGSTDQNLILFNDATIYNPTHLFGFFSAFNTDIIKDVQLYKSAIPERYGGRLSSVLDITSKEGNNKKISGTGGIGLLTSKLTVEGPLVKDKSSFIISGRSSYSDWLLHQIPSDVYKNSSALFYDVALHVSHALNNRNSIYLNAYYSEDRFSLNKDTSYGYGNRNFNIKWKHNFTDRMTGVFTAGVDDYHYSLKGTADPVNAYLLKFGVQQGNLRADFNYSGMNNHVLDFGINSIYYKIAPGSYTPVGDQSKVKPDILQNEQALESAVYIGDNYTINPKLSVNGGLRYSIYQYLGPSSQFNYSKGIPKDESTIIDTINYKPGTIIHTYGGPELRIALRYSIDDSSSVKFSINTLRQYIHMLSNTTAISPTDIWKLSDTYIQPQQGQQVSLGYYRNFKQSTIETSLEVYYKQMTHFLDYKSGATLILNHHIETDVINSKGYAYGAEVMIRKIAGKLNGWISYTYSRTFLKSADTLAGEQVNGGNYYAANFDKPNSVNFISNYQFSHRYSMSLNVVYSTGRPITLPIAVFNMAGGQRVYYSERNQFRIPDYFRVDLSVNIEGNHKIKKLTHNSWSIGVYNATARKNPYSIYFIEENGVMKGYQLSVFGTAIPYITYNFRF
jgi:Outer membrane receptor proteins, mostly Fe transport